MANPKQSNPSWLILGINPDTKEIIILHGIGLVNSESEATTVGIQEAQTKGLNPDNNLIIDLTRPAAQVRPVLLEWMQQYGIPDYQASSYVKTLAKQIHEMMQRNKSSS